MQFRGSLPKYCCGPFAFLSCLGVARGCNSSTFCINPKPLAPKPRRSLELEVQAFRHLGFRG